MYNDLFSIGPISVHSYGVCIALGLLAALWLSCKRAKAKGLDDDICYGILFSATIFGFLGSKILFTIIEWESFIADPKRFLSSSGFVVVGGLTTGFLAVFVYCKIKKVSFIDYVDACIPAVPLAQGLGRIGCFMAGCCYGRQTDSIIGIAFTHSDFAPNNVKLIPTQLISAVGDWIIVLIILLVARKIKNRGFLPGVYFVCYSVGRFLIEFLRNDYRGSVGFLSTSQFYSIIAFAVGVVVIILSLKYGKPSLDEADGSDLSVEEEVKIVRD